MQHNNTLEQERHGTRFPSDVACSTDALGAGSSCPEECCLCAQSSASARHPTPLTNQTPKTTNPLSVDVMRLHAPKPSRNHKNGSGLCKTTKLGASKNVALFILSFFNCEVIFFSILNCNDVQFSCRCRSTVTSANVRGRA